MMAVESAGAIRGPCGSGALPGKPSKLSLRRNSKGQLTITWRGTAGAARQLLQVQIADGRQFSLTTKKRAYRVSGVARTERVTATVRGLTKDGRLGPKLTRSRGRR